MRRWETDTRIKAVALDCDFETNSVLLPYGAGHTQTEAALSSVGIYAPRGLDTLEWGAEPEALATIYDGNGEPIVHLYEV